MTIVVLIAFIGVFSVVALVLVASGTGASQQTKKVVATLDSALATSVTRSSDQAVDLRRSELLSAVPWINRMLAKIELAPRLRLMLYQAHLKWTVGGLLMISGTLAFVVGYLFYLRTGSAAIAPLIGLVGAYIPFFYVLQKRKSRFGKFEQQLPEALDLMVSALRVGHSLNAALGLVTREGHDPLAGEFRICYDEQNYGLELRTAVDNLVTRVPIQDLKIVCTAILIQKESGGNLAEVLEKTSHVIRERFRLKRQISTHTAQGRLTGWILSLLPVVLGVALYFINPDQMSLLWKRDIGVKLLYGSGAATIVGTLIIRKIVNMDV